MSIYLKGFHELPSARLSNGTQVVDKVRLGHSNPSVVNGEGVVILVRGNSDLQLLFTIQDGGVCKTLISDFVQCLGKKRVMPLIIFQQQL